MNLFDPPVNPDLEKYVISGVLNDPQSIIDPLIGMLEPEDFASHSYHRSIWSVIKDFVKKGEVIDRVMIAQRITALRFDSNEQITAEKYLESLFCLQNAKLTKTPRRYAYELKRYSVIRELCEAAKQAILNVKECTSNGVKVEDIVELYDKTINNRIDFLDCNQEFDDLFGGLEDHIEMLGETQPEISGFLSPWKRYNELYGPLRDGSITIFGATSGLGKSTYSMYMATEIAKSYTVPVLHLDHGEMGQEELQFRIISMLSGGKISYNLIETGKWRNNEELTRIMREEALPQIKKYNLRNFYRDISGKTATEVVSLIRRFYLSKIGRGNKFVTNLDYLKPFSAENHNTQEWQEMGRFIQNIKSLYKNELASPFMTSIQLNRSGVFRNKTAQTIDDSEATFSMSTRISEQATHSFILREVLMDEMAVEGPDANHKMIAVKTRHLGEKWKDAINPVEMPDGSYKRNYLRFKSESFDIKECGDLKQYVAAHREDILLAQGGEFFDGEEDKVKF